MSELNCLIWINEMIQKCPDDDLPSLLKNIAFISEDGKSLENIPVDKAKEIKNGFRDYVVKQIEKETFRPIPYGMDTSDYLNPYARFLVDTEQFKDAVIKIAR